MPANRCPICKTIEIDSPLNTSLTSSSNAEVRAVRCWRCGRFSIDESILEDKQEGLPREDALRLSGVVRARSDLNQFVTISYANLEQLIASATPPATAIAYYDQALIALGDHFKVPGSSGKIALGRLAALCYLPTAYVRAIVRELEAEGLFEATHNASEPDLLAVTMKAKGWARLGDLRRTGARSRRAFIAMGLDNGLEEATNAMRSVLIAAGYSPPFKVDDREYDELPEGERKDKVDDRIIALIRESRFVVADVTNDRSAVYFEAGFAQGLGIPVIWTCRSDRTAEMCFDTRQTEHIVWQDEQDLKERLTNRIAARGWRLT